MQTQPKVETFNRNVKFKAGLSNGETIFEGRGDFALLKGELAPWLRLLTYLKEKDLKITSLGLYTDKGHNYNLPSLGRNPKFKAFSECDKPDRLHYMRKLGQDFAPMGTPESFAIVVAEYKNYSLEIWVSEENPDNSWVLSTTHAV